MADKLTYELLETYAKVMLEIIKEQNHTIEILRDEIDRLSDLNDAFLSELMEDEDQTWN